MLLEALKAREKRLPYVVCRHESGAAYAADGYARVRGTVGVVIVTSGPGATNALTGTVNAHNSRTPILLVTGELGRALVGKGYLQDAGGPRSPRHRSRVPPDARSGG